MQELSFEYVLIQALFIVAVDVFFNEKTKIPLWQMIGAGVVIVVCQLISTNALNLLIVYCITMITQQMSMKIAFKARIFQTWFVFFILTGMGEFVGILFTYMCSKEELIETIKTFCHVLCLLILLFALMIKKISRKKWKAKALSVIQKAVLPMLFIVVFILYFTVMELNYAYWNIDNPRFKNSARILAPLGMLSIFILGIIVLVIQKMGNEALLEKIKKEELNQAQMIYYEQLLKKEDETKRYRHDVSNHLICLETLVEKEEWEQVKKYLESMQGKMKEIKQISYKTGNDILDIYTNYYLADKKKQYLISMNGQIENNIAVSDYSLSTIYANILKNAVEELDSISDARKKELHIEFNMGENMCRIAIINTIKKENMNLKRSNKKGKEHHGYGLQNVEMEVRKNGGEIIFTKKEETLTVEVFLPIKTTTEEIN